VQREHTPRHLRAVLCALLLPLVPGALARWRGPAARGSPEPLHPRQILFHCGDDELADEGPRPAWGAISKTRRGGHLHLGRCFSVVASAHNVLTDDGGRRTLFSFVVLGGHERHIFWAESEEERNAWVHDIQAVVGAGNHLTALSSPARHQMAVHDHALWDTALWELRSAHQKQLEHEKDGIRSSVGLVCSGTRVSKILPGSPASKSLRCFHSNEEIQLEVDDEILEVNNETVLADTCASMLHGDDVVGSMMRIKVRKSSNPSPIAREVALRLTTPGQSPSAASPSRSSISVNSVQRLMTPGQTPSAASPSRSSVNSSSPYRDMSQLGAGEHVIDVVSVPLISLLSFQALTQTIENLKDLEGSGPLVAKLQKQADGLMESLEAYSSYAQSHVKGLEDLFHGLLVSVASRLSCLLCSQVYHLDLSLLMRTVCTDCRPEHTHTQRHTHTQTRAPVRALATRRNAGEMALAANRENMWVNINTRLVKEIEQLREVSQFCGGGGTSERLPQLISYLRAQMRTHIHTNPRAHRSKSGMMRPRGRLSAKYLLHRCVSVRTCMRVFGVVWFVWPCSLIEFYTKLCEMRHVF
jgi:hypothetical protein